MENLSDSFTKLVSKINEVSRKNERSFEDIGTIEPCDLLSPKPPPRPGSPFIVLLTDDGEEEEFHYNLKRKPDTDAKQHDECNKNIFEDSALGSSTSLDDVGKQSPESKQREDMVQILPGKYAGTPEMSGAEDNYDSSDSEEAAMLENDAQRSHRSTPLSKELFEKMFDHSGRLIQEHDLRKIIFKGGVNDSIRKDVWKFLFELYPFNSTAREREVLSVENTVRYEAMKIRWKKILKTLVNDYEGVRYCPKWYSGCPTSAKERARIEAIYLHSSNKRNDTINQVGNQENCDCDSNVAFPSTESKVENDKVDNNTTDDIAQCFDGKQSDVGKSQINNEFVNPEETAPSGLECKEIDNISDALADAMLDCEHSDSSVSTRRTPNSLDTKADSPDYVCPELSSRTSNEDIIHITVDEDKETGEFNEKRFPNPFTLSAEYINTHESLYAQSDNFESLDIYSLKSKNTRNVGDLGNIDSSNFVQGTEITSTSETVETTRDDSNKLVNPNNISTINSTAYVSNIMDSPINPESSDRKQNLSVSDENTILYQNNTPLELSDNGQSDSPTTGTLQSSCNNIESVLEYEDNKVNEIETLQNGCLDCKANNEITAKSDNKNCGHICSFDGNRIPSEVSQSNEQNNQLHVDFVDSPTKLNFTAQLNNGSTHLKRASSSEDGYNIHCGSKTPDALVRSDSDNNTNPVSVLKTPTPNSESLERLSPFVAQMIKASTSTGRREKTRFEVEVEEIKQNEKRQQEERLKRDQELLGIIKNANKFVEENIKQFCDCALPKASQEKQYETEIDPVSSNSEFETIPGSSFMSPLPSSEVDIFLHDLPCLKLFSENDMPYDSVDFSPKETSQCPYCSFKSDVSTRLVLSESLGEDQLKFMEIQAQVFAARQPYDSKNISESIRVIDKDVPRTDRELDMFSGDSNPGLLKLRDALLTYAFFHPDVGYAQGMNDIMSRFLYVMDSEVEAYWMFVNYMEHFKNDFMEAGMLRKIALVEQLLMKMDRDLHDYLQSMDMGLIFCHRWLLLNFKREFEYLEAIRLFEITSSRHLEVSSLEAEIERSKERAKEFLKDTAGSHMEEVFLSPEYPFDIFVCVAMLMECRHMIMDTEDITAVYTILSNLPTTLDLQNILRRSEELFYRYCRKTTVDCFQIIDELEVKDFKKKKLAFPFSFGNLQLPNIGTP